MRPRWTKASKLALTAASVATLAAAAPVPSGDPHVPAVPRDATDRQKVVDITRPAAHFTDIERFETRPGGGATVPARTDRDAFAQPSAGMDFERELDFRTGNALFQKLWVSAPSSTKASDGLGPLYNARACESCHIRDGRGDPAASLVMRLSVPGEDAPMAGVPGYHATAPDPVYGAQLQDVSLPGHPAEYRLEVTYAERDIALSGGETARLRAPAYALYDLGYGPLHARAMTSPRIAPPMIGLGLLEAIPAADILARADEDDRDGDGISGKANVVWSREHDHPMLGRFGHKAGQPTIRQQVADAFAHDLGLSTPLYPDAWGDCTARQGGCRAAPHGDGDARVFEVDGPTLDIVAFYSRNLAVPARRRAGDRQVLRGKKLFYDSGCVACHTPKFVTHRLEGQPEQSFQLIWPYSDLLLHDMGEGLADHRPEGRATGREWRTAPLWGIGLTAQVGGQATYLHDGRARSLLEAILWHGGEAQAARDTVVAMPAADRADLIRFLESL
ncbi:c-type cytochrome [Seohaeicola saemankumensis]|nr:di-heme oxidoredictase family protein [Seohaeicola saemankumensis]MCA0871651.1 c-type cytochrome [Seohaeicola saemankumensis]